MPCAQVEGPISEGALLAGGGMPRAGLFLHMNYSCDNQVGCDQVPISEGAGLSARGCLEGARPRSGERKKQLDLCLKVPGRTFFKLQEETFF